MAQEKWSSKESKKAGQKFRREARNIFADYQRDLFKKLDEVRIIIRPRPRLIPRKVWLWLGDIFVDLNNANKALVFETPSDFLTRKHNEAVANRDVMKGTANTNEETIKKDEDHTDECASNCAGAHIDFQCSHEGHSCDCGVEGSDESDEIDDFIDEKGA